MNTNCFTRRCYKCIDRCLQLDLPESERVESCCWIAHNYWQKLKELIKDREFKDESEEIDFFRNVKPQFTFYAEYFVILSEALMFVPKDIPSAIDYWQGEEKRFNRFCNKHQDFISYYENNQRHSDSAYFLRANVDPGFVSRVAIFGADTECCSNYDRNVSGYLAQKKYYEYVKQRIQLLKQQEELLFSKGGQV